jgi:hypothetical protein
MNPGNRLDTDCLYLIAVQRVDGAQENPARTVSRAGFEAHLVGADCLDSKHASGATRVRAAAKGEAG